MNNSSCVSEHVLAELLQGKLADDRLEQVVQHVDDCSECQDTVQMLAQQSDTFANAWQGGVAEDSGTSDPEYRQAAARLPRGISASASPPPIRTADLPIEQLGPYLLLHPLGSGGMGTVYKALHTKLKRHVALKVLPATRWTKAAAVARFEREMEAIGQLDHPHIVRASDAGEDQGMHYLAMDYVDGLDLSRVVSRLGQLPVADACEVARQTALALQSAHENRLVHRDIKPSNLMLTRDGDIKLLDLGLALLGDEHAFDRNELTTVGQLMGTLDYMSPEQGMDSHEVDIRADIYSLGATLYKVLTGGSPFSGPNYNTLLKKVVALANRSAPSVGIHRDDLPPELVEIIDRMLSKDPQERFDTPQAVVEALAPFASEANLASLSRRAMRAAPGEREVHEAGPLPPVAGTLPTLKPQPGSGAAGGGGWLAPIAIAVLFCCALAAAAFVIHLQTDRGELIVRAEAPDARVVIKRAGRRVQEMELEKGDNRLTVRSGEYQIELLGQSDEMELTKDSLIVRRGQQVIVSILERTAAQRKDAVMAPPGGGSTVNGLMAGDLSARPVRSIAPEYLPRLADKTADKTLYDGRRYAEWLAMLEVERKPEVLTEAVRALASLSDEDPMLAEKSVTSIVRLMRRFGSRVIAQDPRSQLIMNCQTVLVSMPADIVVNILKNEITAGNTRSLTFVNYVLGPAYATLSGHSYGAEGIEFITAVNRSADELTRLFVELPEDKADAVRADSLSSVIGRCDRLGKDCRAIEGLVPRLRRGLMSLDYNMQYVATHTLVKLEPEHEELVPALIRLLSSPQGFQQRDALHSLGQLGPKAAPAVPKLMQLLRSDSQLDGQFISGMGGMGGGGMGGMETIPEAIATLGKIGPPAKGALPLLRELEGRGIGAEEAIAKITGKPLPGGLF